MGPVRIHPCRLCRDGYRCALACRFIIVHRRGGWLSSRYAGAAMRKRTARGSPNAGPLHQRYAAYRMLQDEYEQRCIQRLLRRTREREWQEKCKLPLVVLLMAQHSLCARPRPAKRRAAAPSSALPPFPLPPPHRWRRQRGKPAPRCGFRCPLCPCCAVSRGRTGRLPPSHFFGVVAVGSSGHGLANQRLSRRAKANRFSPGRGCLFSLRRVRLRRLKAAKKVTELHALRRTWLRHGNGGTSRRTIAVTSQDCVRKSGIAALAAIIGKVAFYKISRQHREVLPHP